MQGESLICNEQVHAKQVLNLHLKTIRNMFLEWFYCFFCMKQSPRILS